MMANSGGSNSNAISDQVSCLMCSKPPFSSEEIYGHVAVDHFGFLRFGCPKCDFKAPYEDIIFNHVMQRGHGFKPVDYGVEAGMNGYLNRLANVVTEQCRVVSASNSNCRVFSDLDRLFFSYRADAVQQETSVMPQVGAASPSLHHRDTPSTQSVDSSTAAVVAFIPPGSNGSSLTPIGQQQNGSNFASGTAAAAACLQDFAPCATGRLSSLISSQLATEALITVKMEYAETPHDGGAENPELQEEPMEEQPHDGTVGFAANQDPQATSVQCTLCKATVLAHEKQNHVLQHLSASGLDLNYQDAQLYSSIAEQWRACFGDVQEPGDEEAEQMDDIDSPAEEKQEPEAKSGKSKQPALDKAKDHPVAGSSPFASFAPRVSACALCGEMVLGPSSGHRWAAKSKHAWGKHSATPPYKCDFCDDYVSFTFKHLRGHVQSRHPEMIVTPQRRVELLANERTLVDQCFPAISNKASVKQSGGATANNVSSSAATSKSGSSARGKSLAQKKLGNRRSVGQLFTCNACNVKTDQKSMHVWEKHMINHPRFNCSICGSKAVYKSRMLRLCDLSHTFDINSMQLIPESTEAYKHQYELCFGRAPLPKALKPSQFDANLSAVAGEISPASDRKDGPPFVRKNGVAKAASLTQPRKANALLEAARKKLRLSAAGKTERPTSKPTTRARTLCRCCQKHVSSADFVKHVWIHHMNGVKRYSCGVCHEGHNKWYLLQARCYQSHPAIAPIKQELNDAIKQQFLEQYRKCKGKKVSTRCSVSVDIKSRAGSSPLPASASGLVKASPVRRLGTTNPPKQTAEATANASRKRAATCSACSRRVKGGTYALKEHALGHHFDAHDKLYECSKCGYGKNVVISNVRNHVRDEHKGESNVRLIDRRSEFADEVQACFDACFPGFRLSFEAPVDEKPKVRRSADDVVKSENEDEELSLAMLYDLPSTSAR